MTTNRLSRIGVGCALALAAAAAMAGPAIQGSFEGVATGSRFDAFGPNGYSFDGEVVSGMFSIDASVPPTYLTLEADRSWSVHDGSTIGLTVHAHGQTATFGNMSSVPTSSFIALSSSGAEQVVSVSVDGAAAYRNAEIRLVGTSFFDGLDVTTLRAGDIDLGQSYVRFDAGRAFGSGVTLTSLTFASPVPEPGTVSLMGLGLLALALGRCRREKAGPRTERSPAQGHLLPMFAA